MSLGSPHSLRSRFPLTGDGIHRYEMHCLKQAAVTTATDILNMAGSSKASDKGLLAETSYWAGEDGRAAIGNPSSRGPVPLTRAYQSARQSVAEAKRVSLNSKSASLDNRP